MGFKKNLYFPVAMWLLSRGVILLAMLVIAPLLPAPSGGIQAEFSWDVFSAWDSKFYEQIATSGYEYIDNQPGANFAFFPLFPLIINLGMHFRLSFEQAGTIINSIAFLGALILLYDWVKKRHSISEAKWVTAIAAWCPFSLFGTVIYTEGIFLLFSIGALRAFEEEKYLQSALWSTLATATRITGLALIPTFLLVAWRKRLPLKAYIASLAGAIGIISYSCYCWIKIGQPLAFIIVQKRWQPEQDFWGQGWIKMLAQVSIGPFNWNNGGIKDPWHPLLFVIIITIGYLLWYFREKWGSVKSDYGFYFLGLVFWILAGDPLINTVMVLGGLYLLWYSRHKLSLVTLFYGLFNFAIIFSSGRTASAERYAYGIVSLAIALGLLVSSKPRWGYGTIVFFAILLLIFSIRFSQHLWVA